jgi:hypothetical protein
MTLLLRRKQREKKSYTYKLQTHPYKRCFVKTTTTFVSFEVVGVITFARNDLEVSLSTTQRRRRRRVGTSQDEQGVLYIHNGLAINLISTIDIVMINWS